MFGELGCIMVCMYFVCDVWVELLGFNCCCWDVEGLLGEVLFWGWFWENLIFDGDIVVMLCVFCV